MTQAAPAQNAINAGEVSPLILGRQDIDKYAKSLYVCFNGVPLTQGGWTRRPGTVFLHQTKHHSKVSRLIPFQYSVTQTYVLEFGNLYVRIFSNGAPVIDVSRNITAITRANPGVLTVAAADSTGQMVDIDGIVGMTELNGRTFKLVHIDATHVSLTDMFGNPIDTTNFTPYVSGGTYSIPLTLVTPYAEGDLPLLKYAQSADTMTLTHPSYPVQLLERTGASTFTLTPMVIGPQIDAPDTLVLTPNNIALDVQYGYVVTAVSLDGKEESLPCHPSYANAQVMDTAKCIKLKWNGPTQDISHFNIYKYGGEGQTNTGANRHTMNSVFGFIGQSLTTQFTDTNVAPDFTKQPPQFFDPFAPGQIQGPITITNSGTVAWDDTVPPTVNLSGGSPVVNGFFSSFCCSAISVFRSCSGIVAIERKSCFKKLSGSWIAIPLN